MSSTVLTRRPVAEAVGLAGALALVAVAMAVPGAPRLGRARALVPAAARGLDAAPRRRHRAGAGDRRARPAGVRSPLAESLTWGRLLLASYVAGLAWMLALAFVDGQDGVGRRSSRRSTSTSRSPAQVHDVPQVLLGLRRPDPVLRRRRAAGRPTSPATRRARCTFFVGAGPARAGRRVRRGHRDHAARGEHRGRGAGRAADPRRRARRPGGRRRSWCSARPRSGSACRRTGCSRPSRPGGWPRWPSRSRPPRRWAWSVLAGLLLGCCVMMSYGLPLLGILALAVLWLGGSWRPLCRPRWPRWRWCWCSRRSASPGGRRSASCTTATGTGSPRNRPASYWIWGEPRRAGLLAPGRCSAPGWPAPERPRARCSATRSRRAVLVLPGPPSRRVAAADLSRMSKAEVERIWLPFVPWLLIATAFLPAALAAAGAGGAGGRRAGRAAPAQAGLVTVSVAQRRGGERAQPLLGGDRRPRSRARRAPAPGRRRRAGRRRGGTPR